MQLVHVYLNFPGNTDEALELYAQVFGTKLLFRQTFGETGFIPNVPEHAKGKVAHAQLPATTPGPILLSKS